MNHFSADSLTANCIFIEQSKGISAYSLWQTFESSHKIAWKTGTSYGHRDAWAIGVTPEYTVGVWVGNADGVGRPGLTGASCAAPIMFDVFNFLPGLTFWNEFPYDETVATRVCRKTGMVAGLDCPIIDTLFVPKKSEHRAGNCKFHAAYWLNTNGERVNRNCSEVLNKKVFFKLPPVEAYYYRRHHPGFKKIPKWDKNCRGELKEKQMRMIYPKWNSDIIIPKEVSGNIGRAIFKLAHQKQNRTVFWYLDQKLIGQTTNIHHLALAPSKGEHDLYLIDNEGDELFLPFTVK